MHCSLPVDCIGSPLLKTTFHHHTIHLPLKDIPQKRGSWHFCSLTVLKAAWPMHTAPQNAHTATVPCSIPPCAQMPSPSMHGGPLPYPVSPQVHHHWQPLMTAMLLVHYHMCTHIRLLPPIASKRFGLGCKAPPFPPLIHNAVNTHIPVHEGTLAVCTITNRFTMQMLTLACHCQPNPSCGPCPLLVSALLPLLCRYIGICRIESGL